MSRTQGIGNAFYGRTDVHTSDNSYVTTEWFVLFLLPIFPLRSLRVIKVGKRETSYIVARTASVSYRILGQIPIKNNIKQIVTTYLFTYGIIGLFIASWFLVNISDTLVWIPLCFGAALLVLALVKSE